MARTNRLALLGGLALLFALAGTVLATRQIVESDPSTPETVDADESPPSAADIAHAAERLRDHGIEVEDAVLAELAARYGVGGAARIVAWAADPDDEVTVESISAMRDGDGTPSSGMGWGRIAKELGVHPGLGSIMGNGGGHGRDHAPGQQDDEGS
jgi:hypothetical protein